MFFADEDEYDDNNYIKNDDEDSMFLNNGSKRYDFFYDDEINGDKFYYTEQQDVNLNDKKNDLEEIVKKERECFTELNISILKTGDKTKPSKDITRATIKEGLIFKIEKEFKDKTGMTGRKRNNQIGKHSKYSYDNVTRKLKTKLFEVLLLFLNSSLVPIEIENPKKFSKKKIYSKPFFLKISQDIIKDINVDMNQKLLKSKLKEIFSCEVSKKVESYGKDYNKKLIDKIYEENIQTKTIGILERTFLECLEHFRGTAKYPELEGLENEYQNVINKMKEIGEEDDYIEIFKDFVNRFESYYDNKKARPKKE